MHGAGVDLEITKDATVRGEFDGHIQARYTLINVTEVEEHVRSAKRPKGSRGDNVRLVHGDLDIFIPHESSHLVHCHDNRGSILIFIIFLDHPVLYCRHSVPPEAV